MPEKPTVIEKTIIKEIHDAPVVVDLSSINNKLDALLDLIMTIEDDVNELKNPQKDTKSEDTQESNNDPLNIVPLLTAIAEAVGNKQEVTVSPDVSAILLKEIRDKLLEIINNQEIIIESNNEIKDML